MDWLPVLKVAIAFVILFLAAWSDWRTREASDLYWIVLGIIGIAFLGIQLLQDSADTVYFLILIPIAIFFMDIFWERKGMFEDGINLVPLGMYALSFIILAALVAMRWEDLYLWGLMLIPIMFFLFILFYQFDIIKGGADAKALIALAIMFPLYPMIDGLPLIAVPSELSQFVIPYPLLLLFNAALTVLVIPVALLVFNLVRGSVRFPAMLFGYRMRTAEAKKKFVWPMEYIEDGQRKFTYFPKGSDFTEAQLDQLLAAGAEEIWVTPKIPFLIPITISVVFSAVVGNLFFLLIR